MFFTHPMTGNYILLVYHYNYRQLTGNYILLVYHCYTLFQLQDDNVAFLGLLVSSFPAALVMKYIPHPNPKQVINRLIL